MRLYAFEVASAQKIGVEVGGRIADLNLAYASYLASRGDARCYDVANLRIGRKMIELIQGGEPALEAARATVDYLTERPGASGPSGERLLFDRSEVKVRAPLQRPGKVLAAAGNDTTSKGALARLQRVQMPVLFIKTTNTVIGDGDDVVLLPEEYSQLTTTEVEVGAIVGKRARMLRDVAQAEDIVFGYTIHNDVTAQEVGGAGSGVSPTTGERLIGRRLPTEDHPRGGLVQAKNYDTFGIQGPCIVTKDEIPVDLLNNLDMGTKINGKKGQRGNTRDYFWKSHTSLKFFSQFMTLEPGDMLSSGTIDICEEAILHPGDEIETYVDRIGTLHNRCLAWKDVWGDLPGHWAGP